MHSRRAFRSACAPVAFFGVVLVACQSGNLIVGDDTKDGSVADSSVLDASSVDSAIPDASAPDGTSIDSAIPDATPPDGTSTDSAIPDAAPPDVGTDAAPGTCASIGGSCLASGSACTTKDLTATCAGAGQFCCKVQCPSIIAPGPNFCDGGTYAAKYASNGCMTSFACAPVLCTAAGGTCVPLVPGSCPTNHYGDATKYDCGLNLGTTCCLP